LLLSEWGWRNKADANFYLAPTRAWELFAGSIAAFIVQKNGVQKNNFLALLGLAAIIFSIFAYDENTPFPSVYALVPVLGVVLLVLYADSETITAKLLGTKVFVGIGLISYSAYLWHQPLFALARIKSIHEPTKLLMASLALSSLLLAYFSWKFIETPFRSRNVVNRKILTISTSLGFAVFIGIGLNSHLNESVHKNYFLEYRLNTTEKSTYLRYEAETDYDMYQYQKNDIECHHWQKSFDNILKKVIKDCESKGQKTVLIVGGSHAMNLYNVLSLAMPEMTIIGVSQGFCRLSDWKNYCAPNKLFEFIKKQVESFDMVIYHQVGLTIIKDDAQLKNLKENLQKLSKILGPKLSFWGPWVEGRTDFIDIVENKVSVIPSSLVSSFTDLDSTLKNYAQSERIRYFSLFELFLPYQINLVEEQCLLYRDYNHLSRCAEQLFAHRFKKEFSDALLIEKILNE